MTELKTYKMGTASPLEGEVLNGGNDIENYFFVRLQQHVQNGPHSWIRGVVLKIRRDVLSDLPSRSAEMTIHRVSPPPEDSPECGVHTETAQDPRPTFYVKFMSGRHCVVHCDSCGCEGNLSLPHSAPQEYQIGDEVYYTDLLGAARKGVIKSTSTAKLRGEGHPRRWYSILNKNDGCEVFVDVDASQIRGFVETKKGPVEFDKHLVHTKCIEAHNKRLADLEERINQLWNWVGIGKRMPGEEDPLRTRLTALEAWRWDTAKMLHLIAETIKDPKVPFTLKGFAGWAKYLKHLVENHPKSAPKTPPKKK